MTKEDIKKIIRNSAGILEKYKVNNISLFGSYANGTQKSESDIDFLVEFKEPISLFKHVKFMQDLENIFGKKVEVVTKNALKKCIKDSILSEAILL